MQQREDNEAESEKKESVEKEEQQNKQIRDMGQVILNENSNKYKVELLTIIGEVEGHESAPSHSKTTKYEHVLPKLAMIEDDEEVEGLLILLNTVGGDVEAGLAIAEMIASLSVPTVSLVLGGGHSIGVPMAVSADYSFAVPSATMVIHPVRSSGMFIGVAQTYRNMEKIQDRITGFVAAHSGASKERLEEFCKAYKLTKRESEITCLIAEGKSNAEIAELLKISAATVRVHQHTAFQKVNVAGRQELIDLIHIKSRSYNKV